MADEPVDDSGSEADLPVEEFFARGNARDRGEAVEPVATQAEPPAAQPSESPESVASSEKPKPAADKRSAGGRKASIQAEIDELTTTKHSTRREVEAAQAELTKLRDELATLQTRRPAEPESRAAEPPRSAPPPIPTLPDDPEPKLEQFAREADPYGSWSRAVTRWETRQEHHRIESARRAREIYTTRTTQLTRKLAEYETTHPGFQKALHPKVIDVKFTTPTELGTMLGDLIVDSDHTAALLDHFSRNYADFQRISTLHPALVARELGKIEGRFESASPGPGSKPQPISQAKPINKPVTGSPHISDDDEDESQLPVEEFFRRGNARDAARARQSHPR